MGRRWRSIRIRIRHAVFGSAVGLALDALACVSQAPVPNGDRDVDVGLAAAELVEAHNRARVAHSPKSVPPAPSPTTELPIGALHSEISRRRDERPPGVLWGIF